jgi:flavin-dependent dehydrogenase
LAKQNILVRGGGPAASLASILFARQGANVFQLASKPQIQRPTEILAPAAIRLLAQHRLDVSVSKQTACRGVLSNWPGPDAAFYDYELAQCGPALAVNRIEFHRSLLKIARSEGVNVFVDARIIEEKDTLIKAGEPVKILHKEKPILIRPELVFDATGRAARMFASCRTYCDQLVAFWWDFESCSYRDCLLIEATSKGWWYVPPTINNHTQLVFLTDADLIPKNTADRKQWLSSQYASACLISKVAKDVPKFLDLRGMKAGFSRNLQPVRGRYIAIGEQALALDPLSGGGTVTALLGAEQAVAATIAGRTEDYSKWCNSTFQAESQMRLQTYMTGGVNFQNSEDFWKRRSDNLNPQQQAVLAF